MNEVSDGMRNENNSKVIIKNEINFLMPTKLVTIDEKTGNKELKSIR